MKKGFKRLKDWLLKSNRLGHFLLGVGIGFASRDQYSAGFTGTLVAGAMETKDKLHGGKFDWVDFTLTELGVVVGYTLREMVV